MIPYSTCINKLNTLNSVHIIKNTYSLLALTGVKIRYMYILVMPRYVDIPVYHFDINIMLSDCITKVTFFSENV